MAALQQVLTGSNVTASANSTASPSTRSRWRRGFGDESLNQWVSTLDLRDLERELNDNMHLQSVTFGARPDRLMDWLDRRLTKVATLTGTRSASSGWSGLRYKLVQMARRR